MPATQISFADFAAQALALQAVTSCPPSIVAVHASASVVAHGGDDAGECIDWAGPVGSWSDLHASANALYLQHGSMSGGFFVLLEQANLTYALSAFSNSARVASYERLCAHAARCIGAGC